MPTQAREPALDLSQELKWRFSQILMIVFSLTCFGLVMVYSASAIRAARGGGWEMSYAWNQFTWFGVALAAFLVTRYLPIKLWQKAWPLLLLVSLSSLVLVTTRLGTRVNGATRWFRLGGINIQPSEMAKLAMVVVLAALLARLPDSGPRFWRHFLPLAGVSGLAVVLVAMEPDFGTASLIGGTLALLMLAGGVRLWQMSILALPALPLAAWYGYHRFDYISQRVESWLAGESFHTNVSVLTIGSGGVWGMGIGKGTAKLDYLPEAHTDFIFAMICQETGLFGGLAVLTLFALLVWQCLAVARRLPERFPALLVFGVTTLVGGQALFNMAVVTGLLPPKGISLPFVSFGGSGLVMFYGMIGLVGAVCRGVKSEVALDSRLERYRPRPALELRHIGPKEAL
ncbi:MAG: putative lipid II flippase FtsW [Planctomycetota bacterium]|jgi:cell division protein FtsW|nr:putative lipid II flippase FtsW [Planctomycetota bacterium]